MPLLERNSLRDDFCRPINQAPTKLDQANGQSGLNRYSMIQGGLGECDEIAIV